MHGGDDTERTPGRSVLDSFSLSGRRALVTGGNRGIGLALVRALAEAGAEVAFVARDEARNRSVTEAMHGEGLEVQALAGDITSDADAIVTQAVERLNGLDVLVNNAGLCFHRPAVEVPDAEWDAVFDVNVRSLWKMCVAAAAPMAEQGGGSIINIGSISGMIVNRPQWQPAYNASKAAVHQLTRSLAAEWAPRGIRVNALAPGYVKTEMAPVDEPQFRARWIDDVPQQRYARPEELGPSVVYLASDASSFVTGSVLVVDGGYTVV